METSKDQAMNGTGIVELGFPAWPQLSEEAIRAVEETLRSGKVNYWTGPRGMEFEGKFAQWAGAKYAVSCTNGTAALHIAFGALGIGPGDEFIVPSYTFIASSFSGVQAGAIPVFCDVTEDHTLDPAKIEALITPRTKAIVVVHLYGVVADMGGILAVARKHGLRVIEDCAQCFGGLWQGKKAGTLGDVGCFSFCQSKHFTTGGEGGMVITDNENTAWEARSFRDHGYDVEKRMNMLALEEKLPYIHKRVGFNYRMTEMQSAIGIHELARLDSWNLKRRYEYAAMYNAAFRDFPGIARLPVNTPERANAYWWYPIILDTDRLDIDAPACLKLLSAMKVPCYGIQWPESYLERAYQEHNGFGAAKFPFRSSEYTDPQAVDYHKDLCPVAHSLRARTINLFLHPSWERVHIQRCIDALQTVLQDHLRR
jgi:dTDP-4-amino-4,6-dideoxygalactose transaminase